MTQFIHLCHLGVVLFVLFCTIKLVFNLMCALLSRTGKRIWAQIGMLTVILILWWLLLGINWPSQYELLKNTLSWMVCHYMVAAVYVAYALIVLIWLIALDSKNKHRSKVFTLLLAIATLIAGLALFLLA